jgi:hypothetical protein
MHLYRHNHTNAAADVNRRGSRPHPPRSLLAQRLPPAAPPSPYPLGYSSFTGAATASRFALRRGMSHENLTFTGESSRKITEWRQTVRFSPPIQEPHGGEHC